jgi:hypothetical protein
MHTAEEILVIIVSAALSLFLLAAIVVLVLIARLVRTLRRVIEQAERVVETAGDAAEVLRNVSGPLAVFKIIRNVLKAVEKARK